MNLYIKLKPASVKCFLIEQLLTPGSQSLMNSISNSLIPYMKRQVLTKRYGNSEYGAIDASTFSWLGLGISLRKSEQVTTKLALKDL